MCVRRSWSKARWRTKQRKRGEGGGSFACSPLKLANPKASNTRSSVVEGVRKRANMGATRENRSEAKPSQKR